MSKKVLSICTPTFHRPKRISKIIEQFMEFQNEEVELIISDDNPWSDETEQLVKKYKDPRIKYFHNKINLGYDANLLLSIKRARGKYVFILLDEDDIETKTLPWIIQKIKEDNSLSQIRGTVDTKTKGENLFSYELSNKIIKKGLDKINFFFEISKHASGIVLKKDVLNLNFAKKYLGFLFIQQLLVAQAMLAGKTLYTSKVFAHIIVDEYESMQPLQNGKKWWHPINFLNILKYRIRIIHDLTKNMKNGKVIQKRFRNSLNKTILFYLIETFFYDRTNILLSIKDFIKGLSIIFTMKSLIFSINILLKLIIKFLSIFKKTILLKLKEIWVIS